MNQNSENYFSISPNPAAQNAYFMFNLSKTSNAKIIIYDLLGHKINDIGENSFLPSGSYSFKYNLEKLVPGIYFARLITSSNEKTLKFIKV